MLLLFYYIAFDRNNVIGVHTSVRYKYGVGGDMYICMSIC